MKQLEMFPLEPDEFSTEEELSEIEEGQLYWMELASRETTELYEWK